LLDAEPGSENAGLLDETSNFAPSQEGERTPVWSDEIAAMYQFMTAIVKETDHLAIVERMLETVARRTRAAVCGFLNLDLDHPLPKKVYPAAAEVDTNLSRQLTLRVQRTGSTVWLHAGA